MPPFTSSSLSTPVSHLHQSLYQTLFAVSGTSIRTFGSTTRCLVLDRHHFTRQFLLADVQCPLLGADFLGKHQLLAGVSALTSSIACTLSGLPLCNLSLVSGSCQYLSLLVEYPWITKPVLSLPTPQHEVYQGILTCRPPIWAPPPCCLAIEKMCIAWEEFANLQKLGIIRPHSVWASPLHMALKANVSSGSVVTSII